MSWSEDEFLQKLTAAVERFDRNGTAKLCNELISALDRGAVPSAKGSKTILETLRRKCYFDLMERVAEALRFAGIDENQVRRQYAQALIDQGKVGPAVDVLQSLIACTAKDPKENAEARGLLGRVYKQLYVNEVNADPNAKSLEKSKRHLQLAVKAYSDVYQSDPANRLWHGINAVALIFRARRDGVKLVPKQDAKAMAKEILGFVEKKKKIDHWDMATAAEACVALDDSMKALEWIGQYVQQKKADAFELSSTERQLREVWGLTIDKRPGSLLLPLLQAEILQRKGGQVELPEGGLNATIKGAKNLEKILGADGSVSLQWYQQGLERCRAVAQVRTTTGEGFGTGFLIRGGDLLPALGDELLLLTNAHVVSDDPAVQDAVGSLPSEDAVIIFEALPAVAGKKLRVAELLWTSAPDDLDATLLRLDPPIKNLGSYPIARRLPAVDGKQKTYVIGHPGGRSLSLSLQDNLLLDHDNERLIHYRTPTEGGSSGSPVFNQQWNLIGLHHAGSLEMGCLNGKPGTYAANEGIWIQKIIKELAAAGIA